MVRKKSLFPARQVGHDAWNALLCGTAAGVCLLGDVQCVCSGILSEFVWLHSWQQKKKWENRNLYVTAYNIFCCFGESLGMSNFVLTKFTFQLNFLQDILQ